jgi:hypothetical protein
MESGRTGLPAVLTNVVLMGASINISMRDFWGDLAEVLSRSFYIDLSVIYVHYAHERLSRRYGYPFSLYCFPSA